MGFEETNLRAGAGGGDRSGDAGRAGATDDDVAIGGQGYVPLGLGEHAWFRRSGVRLGQSTQGAESKQGGG